MKFFGLAFLDLSGETWDTCLEIECGGGFDIGLGSVSMPPICCCQKFE